MVRLILNIQEDINKVKLNFSVVDTGCGISEDDFADIFTPFSQLKNKNPVGMEGSGLGLSISKKIIDAMNGLIYAESKIGEGSSFIFELTLPLGENLQSTLSLIKL